MVATRRQREHAAYMAAMAARQDALTERLTNLDDGLEALERLADLQEAEDEAEVKKEVQAMVARAMRAVEARYDRKPSIFDPRRI